MATVAVVLAAVAGCDGLFLSGCTTELRSVIQLDVLDSLTGLPAAGGSTVLLESSTLVDSIAVPDTTTSAIAYLWFEDRIRAGTYTVQVRKPGYRPWTREDIRVRANSCHTTTHEHLIALLQR